MSSQSKPIQVGVAGLGRAGWIIHLAAMANDPRFQIISVADPVLERRVEAETAFRVKSYPSLTEMIAANGVELVVVATPSINHFKETAEILDAGLHCILEKPMATSFQEASELVSKAKKQRRHLLVHHQYAFGPEHLHLKEVLASGVLGHVFHIEANWANYARRWDWQTLIKNGGGLLNNAASHILSALLPLLESRVKSVASDLRRIKNAGDAEDHVHLFLRTETGQTVTVLVTSVCALPKPRWVLFGANGTLISDGVESRLRYFDPSAVPPLQVIDEAAPDRAYQTETLPWQEEIRPTKPEAAVPDFHANTHEVIRGNASPLVPLDDALEVMRVIELARAQAT